MPHRYRVLSLTALTLTVTTASAWGAPPIATVAPPKVRPVILAPGVVTPGQAFRVQGRFPGYANRPVTVTVKIGAHDSFRVVAVAHSTRTGAWSVGVRLGRPGPPFAGHIDHRTGEMVRLQALAAGPGKAGRHSPTVTVRVEG